MSKLSIKSLNLSELRSLVLQNNEAEFRIKQLIEWLYFKNATSFESMTNLPKSFIEYLSSNFVIDFPKMIDEQKSTDGTIKYLLEYKTLIEGLPSSIKVECVAIPSNSTDSNRLTLCISSQAGCSMGCKFCATGQQGFSRNLFMGEILEQVIFVNNNLNIRPTNIVVMGQGEPFLNFENLIDTLLILNDEKGFNIGARKITVSTCGIIPGINRFGNIDKQFGLAVSLHSAIQEKRDSLMPGVKNYTLKNLKAAIKSYIDKTNRRVSFEYLMIKGVNDTPEDLNTLISYCQGLLCHINLIKLNNTPNSKFQASCNSTVEYWTKQLTDKRIETTLRESRGPDIDAACGQLLHKNL